MGNPLVGFFSHLFNEARLVDLVPQPCIPTSSNGRLEDAKVAKRLEKFLVAESLVDQFCKFMSWIDLDLISDHLPICLELDSKMIRPFILLNLIIIGWWIKDLRI